MLHSSHQHDLTAVFKAAQDRDDMILDTPARKIKDSQKLPIFQALT